MQRLIATWNVNSIRAHLQVVCDWLRERTPDVVLLQELKCTGDEFPRLEVEAMGYHLAIVGQRGFNGVAILSRGPIEVLYEALPGDPDDRQARYVEGRTLGLRVASIYAPNGNPVGSDRFAYKLAWLERLREHAARLLEGDEYVVLGGDYNVIPEEIDVHDPEAWADDALFRPESRAAFRAILHLGWYDAFRARHEGERAYTFYDYQGRAFQLGHGIRIDHLLCSPLAIDRLEDAWLDLEPRGRRHTSDHAPLLARIDVPEGWPWEP